VLIKGTVRRGARSCTSKHCARLRRRAKAPREYVHNEGQHRPNIENYRFARSQMVADAVTGSCIEHAPARARRANYRELRQPARVPAQRSGRFVAA
jgi:hypothetical protein